MCSKLYIIPAIIALIAARALTLENFQILFRGVPNTPF
jgi:hypothetical protein